jgi:hypothetical protein
MQFGLTSKVIWFVIKRQLNTCYFSSFNNQKSFIAVTGEGVRYASLFQNISDVECGRSNGHTERAVGGGR